MRSDDTAFGVQKSDYHQSRQLISLYILLQFWDVFIFWCGNIAFLGNVLVHSTIIVSGSSGMGKF